MKVSDLRKKFKNKWVLAKVLTEDQLNRVTEVKPIVVSNSRDKVYKSLEKVKKGAHVATLYTGKVPPRGMSFTFYDACKV